MSGEYSIQLNVKKECFDKLERSAEQMGLSAEELSSFLFEEAVLDVTRKLDFFSFQKGESDLEKKETKISRLGGFLEPETLEVAYEESRLTEKDKGDLEMVLNHILNREWASERNLETELYIKDRRGKRIIKFLEMLKIVSSKHGKDYNEYKGGRKVNMVRGQEFLSYIQDRGSKTA